MAKNRNFDPAAGLFGHEQRGGGNAHIQTPATPLPVSTPQEGEKKKQVSIYLTTEQQKKLHEQTGIGKKERFKNDLVMMGLEVIMSLPYSDYAEMKRVAEQRGVTPGDIVSEALSKYLN